MKATFHPNTKLLKRGNYVICEVDGKYVKTTLECFNIINRILNEDLPIENLGEYFVLLDDAEYIKRLITSFEVAGIIIKLGNQNRRKITTLQ